ncbi:MAG: FG-GAP repeat domain-containing protein [Terriglobales bacterium]
MFVIRYSSRPGGRQEAAVVSAVVRLGLRFIVLVFLAALTLPPVNAQTGMFVPGTVYSPAQRPIYVLKGDYNGDGKADFVVFSDEGTGVPANAYVLLGNGDGTFQSAQSFPLGAAGSSAPGIPSQGFLVANNSKVDDLVVPIAVSNTVNILLGKGDGSFLPFASYTTDSSPTAAVAAQMDGTGSYEVAVVADGAANHPSVSILLGLADGTLAPATIIPLAGALPTSITSGYFRSGVLKTDLAIGTTTGVAVLLGNGGGTFQPEVDYALSSAVTSIATDDFNGDGFPDLVATHGNLVSILLGNGDGTFQAPKNYQVGNGARSVLVAGDLNGDGVRDLAVVNYNDNTFSVLLGNADGTFQPSLTFSVNGIGPYSIASADFNGDGATDLVVTTQVGATPGTLGSALIFLNTRGVSEQATCSPVLLQSGQNTSCTVSVGPTLPGMPVPTGTVSLSIFNASVALCSGTLDANGKMQCQGGSSLGMGAWSVQSDYSGDNNYNARPFLSASTLTVDELNFTTSSPLSSTITAGQTAHFSVALNDKEGYSGSVNLTCTGAPTGAACSVPASVQLPAQINVAVSTTPRAVAAAPKNGGSLFLWASGIVGFLLLPGVSNNKRRLLRFIRALPVWLVFLSACGSSGSRPNPNATPPASYTLTLTATAGGITTSVPMTLTVQ